MKALWDQNTNIDTSDGQVVLELEADKGSFAVYMGLLPSEEGDRDLARAKVYAAAPALLKSLLLTEYSDRCAACHASWHRPSRHGPGCPVDDALTAAGYPDDASRDAARKAILGGS